MGRTRGLAASLVCLLSLSLCLEVEAVASNALRISLQHYRAEAEAVATGKPQRAVLQGVASDSKGKGRRAPSEYIGKVLVGSPAQEFSLIFDTGSANLLLYSDLCTDPACVERRRYHQGKSTSALDVAFSNQNGTDTLVGEDGDRDVAEIKYGTGEVSGILVKDRVCLTQVTPESCVKADLVAATQVSQQFKGAPGDGILGLALPSLARAPQFSVLEQLAASRGLRSMFSVYLGMSEDALPSPASSEIIIGDIDHSHTQEPIWYAPLAPASEHWQVMATDVQLGGTSMSLCGAAKGNDGCVLTVDTGTSILAGPGALMSDLLAKVDVAQDCSNMHALPAISFVVKDAAGKARTLTLEGQDYLEWSVDDKGKPSDCNLSFFSMDDKEHPNAVSFILGAPFLRKYYTVYDVEEKTVGFALAKHGAGVEAKLVESEKVTKVMETVTTKIVEKKAVKKTVSLLRAKVPK